MRYVCQICGYVYDDAKEKVPFEALPDTWKCPLCGAAKSDFKPESQPAAAQPVIYTKNEEPVDLVKLSAGQFSIVCSNLARGCEKQYQAKEAELFRQLADFFGTQTPAAAQPSLKQLADELMRDIDNYAGVRAAADVEKDRGAARVCVWGEKVTRMLSSLVNRYLEEGEALLEDSEIWVCTVCGFVYIGKTAPELCPVCKVPAWKFEKIERTVSA